MVYSGHSNSFLLRSFLAPLLLALALLRRQAH
jgi:hypothetical protein